MTKVFKPMVDREVAEAGLATLSAISELLEETHPAAVSRLPSCASARARRFEELRQVGQNITGVAEAAEVLIRRISRS